LTATAFTAKHLSKSLDLAVYLEPRPGVALDAKLLDRTLLAIPETETIEEAFRRLNANMLGTLFAQDHTGRIVGALTDGDIRRRLLTGVSIHDSVGACGNRNFVWARLFHKVGRQEIDRRFIVFTPFESEFFRRLDSSLSWLPLGAQYCISARVPY
jgi:hypothetical protein